jgi:hypothetical protein
MRQASVVRNNELIHISGRHLACTCQSNQKIIGPIQRLGWLGIGQGRIVGLAHHTSRRCHHGTFGYAGRLPWQVSCARLKTLGFVIQPHISFAPQS